MARNIIQCRQYDLLNIQPDKGQLYYCTDTKQLYKDYGNSIESRLIVNATVLSSDYERVSIIKPINGTYYYVIETNTLWLFDTLWELKSSNNRYNLYNYVSTENEYTKVSAVKNVDDFVTNANGDKIIDNNGLLGNGSVVVRDSNRINKTMLFANNEKQQLEIKCIMPNGISFIPNANITNSDSSNAIGTLHLTNKRNADENYSGIAWYFGEWNNCGNIYITTIVNDSYMTSADVVDNDTIITKIYLVCKKNIDDRILTTNVMIEPIDKTKSIISVVSYYEDSSTSVVIDEDGNFMFATYGDVENNSKSICNRHIYTDGEYVCSKFDVDVNGLQESIIYKTTGTDRIFEISKGKWSDETTPYQNKVTTWTRNKVVTMGEIESVNNTIDELTQRIEKLEKQINTILD